MLLLGAAKMSVDQVRILGVNEAVRACPGSQLIEAIIPRPIASLDTARRRAIREMDNPEALGVFLVRYDDDDRRGGAPGLSYLPCRMIARPGYQASASIQKDIPQNG